MATTDVRKLLRESRDQRRINHPYAKYTVVGALVCIVCDSKISSDALWSPHVQSASHRKNAMRNKLEQQHIAKRALDQESGADLDQMTDGSKLEAYQPTAKRLRAEEKVVEEEGGSNGEQEGEEQGTRLPSGFFDESQQQPTAAPTIESTTAAAAVDEDEWAAFQEDIAQSTRGKDQQQAEEDEEAARDVVADDFDEVERFHQRVTALKSKREALRQTTNSNTNPKTKVVVEMEDDGDDDDDDDLTWHKKHI